MIHYKQQLMVYLNLSVSLVHCTIGWILAARVANGSIASICFSFGEDREGLTDAMRVRADSGADILLLSVMQGV